MATRRAGAARETHSKYPRWFGPLPKDQTKKGVVVVPAGTVDWWPTSSHRLYQLTVKVLHEPWFWQFEAGGEDESWLQALDECRRRLPGEWLDPKAGKYNFLRFVETYLPPRPPHHYLRATLTDDNSLRLHWAFKPYGQAGPWQYTHEGVLKRTAVDDEARYLTDLYGVPDFESRGSLPLGYFQSNPPLRHVWSGPFEMPSDRPPEMFVRDPPLSPSRSWTDVHEPESWGHTQEDEPAE